MDHCVCMAAWINEMNRLLRSINGQASCSGEQCFTNEFGGQSSEGGLSPEDTVALVPFVIMLVAFLVMSVRHFSNRRPAPEEPNDCGALNDSAPQPPQPHND
eukprot:TRINITY_DN1959_c0_g1_i1.p1 TRINITY_DN1959_c0_g1~~TRINITY_DN1959_c0_g1_i1.p1  ORF type:complete len:102 (-),score=17.08 TRINITY_DN1959_c0_g1_i1:300-605(-)